MPVEVFGGGVGIDGYFEHEFHARIGLWFVLADVVEGQELFVEPVPVDGEIDVEVHVHTVDIGIIRGRLPGVGQDATVVCDFQDIGDVRVVLDAVGVNVVCHGSYDGIV